MNTCKSCDIGPITLNRVGLCEECAQEYLGFSSAPADAPRCLKCGKSRWHSNHSYQYNRNCSVTIDHYFRAPGPGQE